ncbi:TPA: DNA-binding protein [Candidatus Woesearchaeota archaeon]|nr:DNA-binding protein [Candidatus Woesearchaeota archaeon]
MDIKDIQANKGNVDVVGDVVSKDSPRSFDKFGKSGRVCNAKVKDPTGMVTLTLWNDDVDKVNIGDKIHIENGWCSEYKGEKQLSTGKFGKIEIVGKAAVAAAAATMVLTNDPHFFDQDGGDDDAEPVEEEEFLD